MKHPLTARAAILGVLLALSAVSARAQTRVYDDGVISPISGGYQTWTNFYIVVPAGASQLTIVSFNATGSFGDADLYVRQGGLPTTSLYTYANVSVGNAAQIVIPNPASGTWYFSLYGYSAYGNAGVSAWLNYPMTVYGAGAGSGTVTASSIACSITSGVTSGTCSRSVDVPYSMTFAATPASGSVFAGWSGACTGTGSCSVNVTAATSVTANFSSAPCTDSYEPNESLAAAYGIGTGSLGGKICSSSDQDWYRISALQGQALTVSLTNLPADYDVIVYDASGTQLGSSNYGGTTSENVVVTAPASGFYYIRVYPFSGYSTSAYYTLTTSITSPVITLSPSGVTVYDTVGTSANETTIAVTNSGPSGTALTGLYIGSVTYGTGASGWLSSASLSSSSAPATLYLTLSSTLTSGSVAPGAYTASVQINGPSSSSQYVSVTVLLSPAPCSDAYEANETQGAAYTIVAGTYSAKICASADQDWYKIYVPQGYRLDLGLSALPADYDLQLYSAAGTLLASSAAGGTTNESITTTSGASDYYYVRVYGYAGAYNTVNSYILSTTRTAPTFALSPTTLTFTATAGGPAPAQRTVVVSNAGASGTVVTDLNVSGITFGSGEPTSWLTAFVNPTTAPATLTVTPTLGYPAGSAPGTYHATIAVTAPLSITSPQYVTVTGVVNPALLLAANPSTCTMYVGATCPAWVPKTASGGTLPYAYSLTPSLPAGLTFSAATGQISGTPTVSSPSTTYSVVVYDSTGASLGQTFTMAVTSQVVATLAVGSKTCSAGTGCTFTPVTASGGTTPYTFAVSPALPSGMGLSTTTGQISGTPAAAVPLASYTVTVTDAVGATGSQSFTLTVNSALVTTQAVSSRSLTTGQVYAAFTPVTASGGTMPYALAVSPALPAGMVLSTTTGQVSGTPSVGSAAATYTVTVTDAAGATSSKTFSLTVNAVLTATQAVASKGCTVGASCGFTPVTAGFGTSPYTYAVSPVLPGGLTMSAASGAVSGTPPGSSALTTHTVTVTDATGATASQTFTLIVNGAVTATQAVASKACTAGASCAFTPVTVGGGTTPYGYSVGTLPTGLSLSTTTGQISGTPSGSSILATYTVTVTDAAGATATQTFSLVVNAALATTQAVASVGTTVSLPVSAFTPVTASAGTTPYGFAVSPALSTGLSFSTTTGQLSGTPTTTSSSTTYTVTVTDAAGATSSKTFSLAVNGPVTATQAVASKGCTVGAACGFTPVTGGGGTTPYAYAVSPALPSGLALSASTGAVSGAALGTSSATYTVTVMDATGATASQTVTLVVNATVVATQSVASKALTVNTAYVSFTPVTASGGTIPYSYAVGTLPTGMTLSTTTGQVSGTPTATASQATYTVTVTDAAGATATQAFTLTVNAAPTTAQAVASKALTANAAYTPFSPVTASVGTTPYAYAVSPALPTGMSYSTTTGQVSGTATVTSSLTTYTVTVTDAAGATSSKTFTVTVNGMLVATLAVPSQTLTYNVAYTAFTPVTTSGGTPTYAYAISPALPSGMAMSATTGQVSGTATAAAQGSYTVTVTDAAGATASQAFSLTVIGPLATTQSVASKTCTVGASCAFTPVTAGGGTTPYGFAVTVGVLPSGLSLSTATGQVSGTPTASSAATSYTVTVTDGASTTSSKTFTLTVNVALTATQTVATKALTFNTLFSVFTPVTPSGGTTPYTYAVSPALPAGLSLNSAGQILGTPAAVAPSATYTVPVTDAAGATASQSFTLVVNAPPAAMQTVASKALTVSTAYAAFTPVTGSSGTTPYGYSVSPTLPTGMSLNSTTGQVSGTASLAKVLTTYTVTVTDNWGAAVTQTFTLVVNSALTTTQAVASTAATVNVAAASVVPVTASGGTTPYGYAVSPALPTGLTFDAATGQLGGTPTATSASTLYTGTVTDAAGATSSKTFTLTVNAAPTATQAVASKVCTAGASCAYTPVTASGGTSPTRWSVSPAVPAGLAFDTTTGAISGTPLGASVATTYTVTVTDARGAATTQTFGLTVNGLLAATQAVASRALTLSTPYSAFTPVTGSGGTPPYTYALSPSSSPTYWPAGMFFSTTTGQVSGTPTSTRTLYTFTVTISDAAGATASQAFTLVVNSALVATQAVSSKGCTLGAACAFTPVTVSNGTTPYGYAVSPALPAGLTYGYSTGQVGGTPTVTSASATYTVTVTDVVGATSTQSFSLVVNANLAVSVQIPTKGCTVAATCTFTPVAASGGTPNYVYALSHVGSQANPSGLAINSSSGSISGTPPAPAALDTFTVTVTDAIGVTATQDFSLLVNATIVATQAVPSKALTVNVAYTPFTPVTGSGGTPTYTYAISPTLPSGMTFSSTTGEISGTATLSRTTTTYTVTITDAAGATARQTFTMVVNGAFGTSIAVGTKGCTVGAACGFTPITASGGTLPYTWAVGSSLPAGMAYDAATGVVSGTPTAATDPALFTVTVTDAVGATATTNRTFTLSVNGSLSAVQGVASKGCTRSASCGFTPVTGVGGTALYSYAVSPSLPAPLSFTASTGSVSGTPSATSPLTTYSVRVTDATGTVASQVFDFVINTSLVANQQVPSKGCTQNADCTFTPVTASGGTPPYTYAVSPALPTGLTLSAVTGTISGSPTVTRTLTTHTVTVTDAAGATASQLFGLTVNAAITSTRAVASRVLVRDVAATAFTPVTATGGTPARRFLISPTLPAGLALDSLTGSLSGMPTGTAVLDTFTVTVRDAAGATSSQSLELTVNDPLSLGPPVGILPVPLPCTIGMPCSFYPLVPRGGVPPYALAVSPALPSGLALSTTTGQVSGTPTATSASTTYTVTVTDGAGVTLNQTFSLVVNPALTTTVAVASSGCTVGAACRFTPVTASGGSSPYVYGVSPALPTGMTTDSTTGQVSGAPTVARATTTYTVMVTDAVGATSSKTFTLTVGGALLATQATPGIARTQGVAAAPVQPVTASAGTAPYRFSVSPALPPGLALDVATGTLSGTASASAAMTTYTVAVTDAAGATDEEVFSLTVNPPLTAVAGEARKVCTAGGTCAFRAVTLAGGTTPYTFEVTPALPAGLGLDAATGMIGGTPTSSGAQATYTLTVRDAVGATATGTFTLTVNAQLVLTQAVATAALPIGVAATPFAPVTAQGGTAPLVFAVAPALPAGLAFDSAQGTISGTPTAVAVPSTYTMTVSDSGGATARQTFTLGVGGPLAVRRSVESTELTVDVAVRAFSPVTAAGGTAPYTYAVAPSLPSGLALAPATGAVSGTPQTASAATTYTVTVADAVSATGSQTFSLTVNPALAATAASANARLPVGTVVTPFAPVTRVGGTAPFAYEVRPALPPDLALSATTGEISGTPTAVTVRATFSLTVRDAVGASVSTPFDLTIDGPLATSLSAPSVALTAGTAAAAFTPVRAAGGTAPYVYAVNPALPSGLVLNTTTGEVSGTPTDASASSQYTVTATDAASATSSQSLSMIVSPPLVATLDVAGRNCTVGTACSLQPVTSTGGTRPTVYSVSPALPAGLSLDSTTGAVGGTPTASAAVQEYTVTATDAAGARNGRTFTLVVNAALATTVAVPSKGCTRGTACAFTPVTVTGGSAPRVFTVSPALPAGLALDAATGAVGGTPSETSVLDTFALTVRDSAGAADSSRTFSLVVNPEVATSVAVPSKVCTALAACAFTPVTVTSGTTPYQYAVTPALPVGLSLNAATGAISGAATGASPTTTDTVWVTDAAGARSFKTFSLLVNSALTTTFAVSARALAVNIVATSFTPVTVSGGTAPYTRVVSPALPAGISMSASTGAISGTPTAVTDWTPYRVKVTDAAGAVDSTRVLQLNVYTTLVTALPISTVTCTVGAPCVFTPVTASGGATPYKFSLGTVLPQGMVIDSLTGAVSGTPQVAIGFTYYTVTVKDWVPNTGTLRSFSLTVNGAITTTRLVASKTCTAGAACAFTPVTASGGTSPRRFFMSPSLPQGVTVDSTTGAVSGTPSAASPQATYSVTVRDAALATARDSFSLAVNGPLAGTVPVPSRGCTVGAACTFTPVTVSGGTTPYTYTLSPTIPAVLLFNTSTGAVSGTPTTTAVATTYTVTVTDAAGASINPPPMFSMTVNGALVTTQVAPSSRACTSGTPCAFTPVTATGGTTPHTYTITPTMPAGLSLNASTGAVSGTPTTTVVATTYTLTVTDAAGATSSETLSVTVNNPLVSTVAQALTRCTAGWSCLFTPVTASGGTSPHAFVVTPTLPAPMLINATTGAISGTPTVASALTTYSDTVTDGAGAKSVKTFQLVVNPALSAVQQHPTLNLLVNLPFQADTPVTASGGTTPYTFSVTPTLPAGLNWSATTGQISGPPTVSSPQTTYTVTVVDSATAQKDATFTLTVAPRPVIALAAASQSFVAVVGGANPDSQQVTVSNSGPAGSDLNDLAVGAVTYQAGEATGWLTPILSGARAPAQLTLKAAIGQLTAGTYHATVAVRSVLASNGPQQTVTVTITVSSAAEFVSAAVTDLLHGASMTPAQEAYLDASGNRNGRLDLGDLLALLDRTGRQLDAATLRRLLQPAGAKRIGRED